MAPDTTQDTVLPPPATTTAVRDKIRIRFRKTGALRLLSHHDLMRSFERMLRRAALPVRVTQGFHPKPRLVFALSLPLGVVGLQEVVELELTEQLPLAELETRLAAQCPPGLELLSWRRIDPRANAQVRALCYRVAVPAGRYADVSRRIAEVLASSECWAERRRPPVRRVDLRPFLRDLRLTTDPPSPLSTGEGGEETNPTFLLEIDLWLTPEGTARPEEVLEVLGLRDLAEAGAVLERTRLELRDETPPTSLEGTA